MAEPLLILWGVPGTGKSTVARWLQDHHGFHYIDTDTVHRDSVQQLEAAWIATLNRHVPPTHFVDAARSHPRPTVAEYGLWATPENIGLLGQLRDLGAVAWWFDGDRDAAFQAWKLENRQASRAMPDQLWQDVVSVINQNWRMLAEFFGNRIVKMVSPGPTHLDPENAYERLAPDLAPGSSGDPVLEP